MQSPNWNWAMAQGRSLPIKNQGTVKSLRGRQGPPQAGEWGVAVFWRFKITFWENIHRSVVWDGHGWLRSTEVLLVPQATPGTEEALDTFIPSQGPHCVPGQAVSPLDSQFPHLQ